MPVSRRIVVIAASADTPSATRLQWKLRQAGFPQVSILDDFSSRQQDIAEHLWRIADAADTHIILLSPAALASSAMHALFLSVHAWQANDDSHRAIYVIQTGDTTDVAVPDVLAGYTRFTVPATWEGPQWDALLRTLHGGALAADHVPAAEESRGAVRIEAQPDSPHWTEPDDKAPDSGAQPDAAGPAEAEISGTHRAFDPLASDEEPAERDNTTSYSDVPPDWTTRGIEWDPPERGVDTGTLSPKPAADSDGEMGAAGEQASAAGATPFEWEEWDADAIMQGVPEGSQMRGRNTRPNPIVKGDKSPEEPVPDAPAPAQPLPPPPAPAVSDPWAAPDYAPYPPAEAPSPSGPPAAPVPPYPVPAAPPPGAGSGSGLPERSAKRSTGAPRPAGSAPVAEPIHLEQARFTAYHPKEIPLRMWQPLLVFVSLDTPVALSRVDAAVTERFGARREQYRGARAAGPATLRRGAKLTIVPEIPGFRCNPAEMTITWDDDVQQHEFQIRAETAPPGASVNGQITIYHGPIIRGIIPVSLFVKSPRERAGAPEELASAIARAYRRVFVSYAHRDVSVVRSCEAAAQSLGDEYLRDVRVLRAGQDFDEQLLDRIRDADLFQLFWSANAAQSRWVRREWEFALSLLPERQSFLRPVYWSRQPYTIPPELSKLHFQRLDLARMGWGRARMLLYRMLGA